jgi:O-antigen/teichoic acid export membrane protein
MASYTDLVSVGNFRIATNFSILLSFFIYPIQTVLFPAFSKLNPSTDKKLLKTVYASSVKYSSLFLVPATMALMILAAPIISSIFGDKWLIAPFFLTLSISGNLLVLIGNLSFGQLLYATGETKMLMKLNILKLCIGIPLAFLLIPSFGILGLIITGFFSGIPSTIIGAYWTWKRFETKADLRNSTRILLASAVAGVTTFLLLNTFIAVSWIMFTAGIILFLIIYIISIPLFGAINQMDVKNLREMFSGMGPISKLLQILLTLIGKSLAIKEKLSKTPK